MRKYIVVTLNDNSKSRNYPTDKFYFEPPTNQNNFLRIMKFNSDGKDILVSRYNKNEYLKVNIVDQNDLEWTDSFFDSLQIYDFLSQSPEFIKWCIEYNFNHSEMLDLAYACLTVPGNKEIFKAHANNVGLS